jgi:transcriptional antiterminator NusG
MFRWYAVNTYSGHEKKVKQNLEHRVQSMGAQRNVRQIVIPTEQVSEMKDGQRVQTEKRTMPGYVLVNMDLNEDTWTVVKGTPGVTGFVGPQNKPVPLSQGEVDRLLKREQAERPRTRAQFSIGESVKVVSVRSPTSRARSRKSWTTPANCASLCLSLAARLRSKSASTR